MGWVIGGGGVHVWVGRGGGGPGVPTTPTPSYPPTP